MKLTPNVHAGPMSTKGCVAWLAVLFVLVLSTGAQHLQAQTFSSGSDGSDGPFSPTGPAGTVVLFDPTQFHGTGVPANIFNFTTITIPAGVTVKLSGNTINGPVFWLAQGNVDIEGTVDLSGGSGANFTTSTFARVPAVPGPGGFPGGVGGDLAQPALPGSGPRGGAAGTATAYPLPGNFSGNSFLIPLVGGSGGGGGMNGSDNGHFEAGGGAGGGALLIASTTQILVNGGGITAQGGNGGGCSAEGSAGGSGGAIRLVSTSISGVGGLNAGGGAGCAGGTGGPGVVRLEAITNSFTGGMSGMQASSTPFPLFVPTVGPATANVISINGTPITPNPSTFPDITLNTTSPVPVVIQTKNIPTTATINLTILDENGVADTVIAAPPLSNCNSVNVCTTTVQVTFPFGGSRGLTKVTWTQ
jgi:hypothetical protein